MESFYIIVLIIAIVCLIIMLTVFGILMKRDKTSVVFPPSYSVCPDYWSVDGSNCIIPTNNINTGNPSPVTNWQTTNGYVVSSKGTPEINFNDPAWSNNGLSATCNQKKWANINGILWSGISNYNGC
jgi:hypothetical protein